MVRPATSITTILEPHQPTRVPPSPMALQTTPARTHWPTQMVIRSPMSTRTPPLMAIALMNPSIRMATAFPTETTLILTATESLTPRKREMTTLKPNQPTPTETGSPTIGTMIPMATESPTASRLATVKRRQIRTGMEFQTTSTKTLMMMESRMLKRRATVIYPWTRTATARPITSTPIRMRTA